MNLALNRNLRRARRTSPSIQTTFTLTTNANNSTAQEINFLKTGEQSLSVDWGDGTTTTGLNHSHTYASAGIKNVVITCDDVSLITSIISDSGHWNYDVSVLPSGLTYLHVTGTNAITGDISDTPSGLIYLRVTGGNTITGNISDAPSGLTFLYISGGSTLTGNTSDAPSGLTYFRIAGNNTIQYNSLFNNIFTVFILSPAIGGAWTATQIDNFLADLNASITANSRTGSANIAGNNADRTSASDADVTVIQNAGWTLTVNE